MRGCPSIPTLTALWEIKDFDIQHDISWIFCSIIDGDDTNLLLIAGQDVFPVLNKLHSFLFPSNNLTFATKDYIEILNPILQIYVNFSTGSEQKMEILLFHNFLSAAMELLQGRTAVGAIQKPVLFVVSNMLMGNPLQRLTVIESGIMKQVIILLLNEKSRELREEALWVIGNVRTDEITELEVKQLAENPFFQASLAHQESLKHFILQSVQSLQVHGYSNVARQILSVLINRHDCVSFFLSNSRII